MLGWLYRAIERWARATPARLNRVLDHVPLWYVRRLAEAKLVRTLRYVWRNAPVQRERWRDAGVTLRDLRSPDVLRHLPFTTGRQLAESPEAFFCVPRSELIHVMGSSGTKGFVKKTYLTHDDLERHLRLAGTHLRRFPGGTRAMAMFPLAYPTWCAGPLVREAITHAGMLGLLSDTQRSIDDQMATIRDYQINVLMSNASYMHRLTLEAGEDLKALGVRYIHLGAQAWSETLREEIETAWAPKRSTATAVPSSHTPSPPSAACRRDSICRRWTCGPSTASTYSSS